MIKKYSNQDFVNMVLEYIVQKGEEFYTNRYKEIHLYNYCLKKAVVIDVGDDKRIKEIVDITLQELLEKGIIKKFKSHYRTTKEINNLDCIIDDSKTDINDLDKNFSLVLRRRKVK